MVEHSLSAVQRRVGYGLMAAILGGFAWAACPGWPASWGPGGRVESRGPRAEEFEGQGTALDATALGDGPAPTFNARSCAACHFQGGVGGGGGNRRLVVADDRLAMAGRPRPGSDRISSTTNGDRAAAPFASMRSLLPVKHVLLNPRTLRDEADRGRPEAVNSPALFGLGLVDRMTDRAIRQPDPREQADRPAATAPGRPHILPDGRVGKFGWKAEFATLEEFLDAGCGHMVGLRDPARLSARARPVPNPVHWRDLVAFVVALPPPEAIPAGSAADAEAARRGEVHFAAVGCVACHKPDLGGLRGVYGDFRLHRLDDGVGKAADAAPAPAPAPTAAPLADEWRTPPLWGVADSAPYLHDGSAATLEAAIARHGGDAAAIRQAYEKLGAGERGDLVAFLRTLRVPTLEPEVANMAVVATGQEAPEVIRPAFRRTLPMDPHVLKN